MNIATKISYTIIALLLLNFIIILSSWSYIYYIKTSVSQDSRIINQIGQIRGSIQKISKGYFFNKSIDKDTILYIDNKINKNITFLGKSFTNELPTFMKLNNEWINYKGLLEDCVDKNNQNCFDKTYNISEKLWHIADTLNTKLEADSINKLNSLKYLSYILGLSLVLLTIMIIITYRLINQTLGRNQEQMEKYIDMVDKNIITSKTDLHGRITYVSKAFCKISGFLPEELIGKNHNIIRHPDMPTSTFKELWNTIKLGDTWSGEIKNRTKQGGYYWVQSEISPYYEYGKHIGYIAVRQDVTNKKIIEELSVRDHLTKLYNRIKLDEEFSKEISRAKRFQHPLSVIILDIDHFKDVNDTYGHLVGDSVLVELAKILENNIRSTDILGRWGGEEFVIICPETDSVGAQELAQKIRKSIEEHSFGTVGNKTASFGISQYINSDNEQQMMARADKALYQAKEDGRNRVVVV